MKLLVLALFTSSILVVAATTESISAGLDPSAVKVLAKRSTERELQRLTPKQKTASEAERLDAASQDDAIVAKIRKALSTRKLSEIEPLSKKKTRQLSMEERHKLVEIFLQQRTRQTVDLVTKLAYGNEEVRDWLTRATPEELDQAIDVMQTPGSADYKAFLKHIGRKHASVARKIHQQVGQSHLMAEPVMAGFVPLPPADRAPASEKK